MKFKNIVLLAGEWDTTPVVFNFLEQHLQVSKAVVENPVSRKDFLKRRIKKLGWLTVAGQTFFQLLIAKPLKKTSEKRIASILAGYHLKTEAIPANQQIRVSSVNAESCLQVLKELNPDLVIVHGTRIISKKILNAVQVPFINIHAGITPRYRGSHGAYWALANGDAENCGVTVHLVDPGIDTGNILAQASIPFTEKDNFTTYPYLQLAEGLLLLEKVVKAEKFSPVQNKLTSALWHHPTLWGYCYQRIFKGVK